MSVSSVSELGRVDLVKKLTEADTELFFREVIIGSAVNKEVQHTYSTHHCNEAEQKRSEMLLSDKCCQVSEAAVDGDGWIEREDAVPPLPPPPTTSWSPLFERSRAAQQRTERWVIDKGLASSAQPHMLSIPLPVVDCVACTAHGCIRLTDEDGDIYNNHRTDQLEKAQGQGRRQWTEGRGMSMAKRERTQREREDRAAILSPTLILQPLTTTTTTTTTAATAAAATTPGGSAVATIVAAAAAATVAATTLSGGSAVATTAAAAAKAVLPPPPLATSAAARALAFGVTSCC